MIAAIETAIVERLRSASALGILGYRLKTVETYGGQFDDMDSLRMAAAKLPAAFVACLGEKLDADLNGGRYRMKGSFAVIVAAKNAGSEQARRHGSPGAVGTYQIRRDVRVLLSDQTLGLDVGYLVPEGTHPFFTVVNRGLQISILSVEFSMTWVEESSGQCDGLPAVLTEDMTLAAQPLTPPGEQPGPREVMAAAMGIAPLKTINGDWLAPATAGQSSVTLEGVDYVQN